MLFCQIWVSKKKMQLVDIHSCFIILSGIPIIKYYANHLVIREETKSYPTSINYFSAPLFNFK